MSDHAAQRMQRAVERELAEEQRVAQRFGRKEAERHERCHGDREVERATALLHVSRRQIDDDAVFADVDAELRKRALHPHATLAHRDLGEADQLEAGNPARGLHLDTNGIRGETDEDCAVRGGEHADNHCELRAVYAPRVLPRNPRMTLWPGQDRGWPGPPGAAREMLGNK